MDNKNVVFINFRNMLIAAFLFIIVVPIFTLSFFINNYTSREIKENFINSTRRQAIQVDKYFTTYIKKLSQDSNFLAKNQFVKKADNTITTYMTKSKSDDGYIPLTPSQNGGIESNIYSVFLDYANTHPEVQCVYIGTIDGGYIQWPESKLRNNYDPRVRTWYKEIMSNREPFIITSPYYAIATDKIPVITTGHIVKNDDNKILGIQAIDVSLDGLSKIVKEIEIGKSGYVILTDVNGVILAHPHKPELNFKNISKLNDEKFKNISEIDSSNFVVTLDGKEYFASIYTSPSIGWKLITMIEKNELMQSVNRIKTLIFILALVLIGIFISIAIIFSNKFSNPLIDAAKQLKQIELGDFSGEISKDLLTRKDELGTFIKSVDSMQNVIRDLMNKVQQTGNEELNYTRYLAEVTEQTETATKQAASAVEQFLKSNEDEARDKELIERKLEKTSANLQQAQKIGRIGNWEWNIEDDSIHLSDEMIRLLGFNKDRKTYYTAELLKKLNREDRINIRKAIKISLNKESFCKELKYIDSKGSSMWLYHSGKILRDEWGKPISVLGITQDITEKRNTLVKLKKMNNDLKVLVRNEVKKSRKKDAVIIYQSRLAKMGEMIDHIAHQWKQPLNNLNLILSNMEDDFNYNELSRERFDITIYNSQMIVNQMAQTIDDFRYFFRPRSAKEMFSLKETVEFSVKLIEESTKLNNIDISIECIYDSKVLGYSNEFTQVLFNILENAKDALLSNIDCKREIGIRIYKESSDAIVEIRNNGGRINEKIAKNIFEPYFTTKSRVKGTGIGLYMSKMIIEEHMNGQIVQFNVENGVCFKLQIPIDEVGHNGES